MKKIYILFVFLLLSCNSNKLIISYLKNNKYDNSKIFVFENKVKPKNAINVLNKQFEKNGMSRSRMVSDEELLELKKRYINDTIMSNWSSIDFKGLEVELIDKDFITLIKKRPEISKTKVTFFSFSKPLYINKRKMILYISETEKIGNVSVFSGVYVFEFIDKKWEIIDKLESLELN